MSDLQLFLVHDAADAGEATTLRDALQNEINSQIPLPSDRPSTELRSGLSSIPIPSELGALSLVLFVNPGRSLTADEETTARGFVSDHLGDGIRLVPVALAPTRSVPPAPLDQLVSAHVHSPIASADVVRLAVHVLNQMCLRLAGGRRKVFVSYRMADGLAIAREVADGLNRRGYQVWRDELQDRDGIALITPGSPAQQTIERGILDSAFVLVIDTRTATESAWVQEEISLAMGYMLPLMPLVVEDVVGAQPRLGGRFAPLQAMQRETRLSSGALTPANLPSLLDPPFFDGLEKEMSKLLLEHLRSRRRLLYETESRFRSMSFTWVPIDPQKLLFRAESNRDTPETPGLAFRLLIQCAPYDVLLDDSVSGLGNLFANQTEPFQYGVLVHQTSTYTAEKRRMLRARGGHLMLLRYDEILRVVR